MVSDGEDMRSVTSVVARNVRADPARAMAPVDAGSVALGGVRVGYETFGEGEDTVVLLPPWTIIHSRFWKAQIPYLARHFRVVSFDARGTGRSDRPIRPEDYAVAVEAEHAVGVLDHLGVERCVLVAHCGAAPVAVLLAAEHPERLAGAVFMSPALPLTPPLPERAGHDFEAVLPSYEGWGEIEPPLLADGFPRLSGVSSPAVTPSRTRPSRSRTASAGDWRRRARRSR